MVAHSANLLGHLKVVKLEPHLAGRLADNLGVKLVVMKVNWTVRM